MFSRILVPLDGSRFALKAFDYAFELADQFNASLDLVRVVKPANLAPISEATFPTQSSIQSSRLTMEIALQEEAKAIKRAKRYLKKKATGGKCQSIECNYHVVTGDPAEEIINVAKNHKADLIVMSSHGLGGIKRAVLGSVTDEVVRKSKRNVLVIDPSVKFTLATRP